MNAPQRNQSASTDGVPVARRLAEFALGTEGRGIPVEVVEKSRACFADFVCCALEAADLPWGRHSLGFARNAGAGPCSALGTDLKIGPTEAAFVNGALGHGLVREDMHVPSCTHMGVVVWPALLALAELEGLGGDDFLQSGAIGYEVGARIGRALFDNELASRIRPTGTVGAIGAAAAGARLLGLDAEQTVAAIGIAANMASGLNEWPWAGGNEMVFHAGAAARSAVTAVLLAREGSFASPTAIDGRAGLFAAYGRRERAALIEPLGDGKWDIMAVYFKPAPACNYVQTPCQAALAIAEAGAGSSDIDRIRVNSFSAAIEYPGCDYAGPYPGIFEAKMSIQYAVAAVLARGEIGEANYRRLDDPAIERLAKATELVVDPAFEAAYPQKQGAEVVVTLKDGRTLGERRDDVRALDIEGVRARLAGVVRERLGPAASASLLDAIDRIGKGGAPSSVAEAVRPGAWA